MNTEPGIDVLVHTQRPPNARAELVLVHGLEGSGEAGYVRSLAHRALTCGFSVHRFHMRTCGGSEHLSDTLYHAGLTSDLIAFLRENKAPVPLFVVGFSLGGNVALKAAAEAGEELMSGVCSVSAPINLDAAASALELPQNRLYQNRFVQRMKERLSRTGRYRETELDHCRSIRDIDDHITAPEFGFGDAANYYETQSARKFIQQIRIPALLIAAKDDPLIPFEDYRRLEIDSNPWIELLAPSHGGHLGFISRGRPRFWADERILEWVKRRLDRSSDAPDRFRFRDRMETEK